MAEKMEFPAGTTPSGVAGRHIVLGLSGGIACYKAAEFCRALIKAGATVQVVMTPSAAEFITPVTMQALSGRAVFISQWDDRTAGGRGQQHGPYQPQPGSRCHCGGASQR